MQNQVHVELNYETGIVITCADRRATSCSRPSFWSSPPRACGLWRAARDRIVSAGFWFDGVSYDSSEAMVGRLGGPIAPGELQEIERVARAELTHAFARLRIDFSAGPGAMYRVRVVQDLRNPRAPRYPGPAGESRSVIGVGGEGALNFQCW